MVTSAAVLCLALHLVAAGEPAAPVPRALTKGGYPWYDATTDSAKSTIPPRDWNWDWVPDWKFDGKWRVPGIGSAGDLVALALIAAALLTFAAVLFWLWRRYEPGNLDAAAEARRRGGAQRIEGLPEGLRPETNDPWTEALRHRQRGDYAAAVICLFAHQLLTLDRLRQLRLVPGRTGRQLVRTVVDRDLRRCVEPTLHLFEAVYYGRRAPSAEAFETVWTLAEQFEQRIGAGVGA